MLSKGSMKDSGVKIMAPFGLSTTQQMLDTKILAIILTFEAFQETTQLKLEMPNK